MSLVNDMLRDLEQRNEPSSPVPGNQSGVKAAQYVEARLNRSPLSIRLVLWAVGIVALAMTLWLLWQEYRPLDKKISDGATLAQPQVVSPVEPQQEVAASQSAEVATNGTADQAAAATIQESLEPSASAPLQKPEQPQAVVITSEVATAIAEVSDASRVNVPVVISDVQWSGIDIGGDLVVKLSANADVQVIEQSATRIKVAFDYVQFDGDLPQIESPLVADFSLQDEEGRLLLVLHAAKPSQFSFRLQQSPPVLVLGIRANPYALSEENAGAEQQDAEAQIRAQVASEVTTSEITTEVTTQAQVATEQAEKPAVAAKPVTKAKSPLTDKQVFRRASGLIDQGKLEQAQALLLKRLASHSADSLASRNLLTTLFLMQGQTNRAQTQLSGGLLLHPQDAGLKKLQSRLWISQGRFDETIALLRQNPPAIADDTAYHEILATAYQQQQQTEEAAEIYYSLLQVDRNVSRWWIGLGYSLELAQRKSEAQNAYNNALSLPQIEPELRAYAEQRLNALTR